MYVYRSDMCERPQNFILRNDVDFFPKIRSLIDAKNQQIDAHVLHEPKYIVGDLKYMDLRSILGTEFESILVDPPWFEYFARCGGFNPQCTHAEDCSPWTFEEIANLRIGDIAAPQSFCFLWCANKHVEQGSACLRRWGFTRIESVCWIKTSGNANRMRENFLPYGSSDLLFGTKEHLLVGIKGTVSRNIHSYLIHANIDSDIVITDQEESGCMKKPEEVYRIIERFCNSQRRIELFGSNHNLRPGWVTVGRDISLGASTYDPDEYMTLTMIEKRFIPTTSEIEILRPKSPRITPRPTISE